MLRSSGRIDPGLYRKAATVGDPIDCLPRKGSGQGVDRFFGVYLGPLWVVIASLRLVEGVDARSPDGGCGAVRVFCQMVVERREPFGLIRFAQKKGLACA